MNRRSDNVLTDSRKCLPLDARGCSRRACAWERSRSRIACRSTITWVRQRIPWFDVKDDLPRFEESSNAVASKTRDDSLNRRGHSSSFEECPLPLIKGGSHPDGVMTSSHLAT